MPGQIREILASVRGREIGAEIRELPENTGDLATLDLCEFQDFVDF